MKLKESKGMSLIVFTIILAVLVVVAGGVIVYLLNNPVKEGTTIQTPIGSQSNVQTIQNVLSNNMNVLEEKSEIIENKNNETSNVVSAESNSNKNEVEIIGLNTIFKELKDVAIYSAVLDKNNKTFEYDLDNDGVKNKLVIDSQKNTIKYDNNKFENLFSEIEQYETHTVYVVDIDKNNSYLDIVVFSKTNQSHEYNILKNVNGNLELIDGNFSYSLGVNKIEAYHIFLDNDNRMLYLDEVESNLMPMIANNYYDLSNGIVKCDVNLDSIINKKFETKAKIYFTTINISGVADNDYWELKENHELLPIGTKFKILEIGELKEVKKVQLEDGRIGYIFPKYGHL